MIALIVGIIVDSSQPGALERLLCGLTLLRRHDPGLSLLHVVLLENPSEVPRPHTLGRLVSDCHEQGLEVTIIDRSTQEHDAAQGRFGRLQLAPGRLPIAAARTMLQRYCAQVSRGKQSPCVWILDEDLVVHPGPLSESVQALSARGGDVAISPILGAAPLPARSTVRVNLEDLHRHLEELALLDPDVAWPDRCHENRLVRDRLPEYYYDFSCAHEDAANRPMWLEPVGVQEPARAVFLRLCDATKGLIHGQPITRDVRWNGPARPTPLARGGNTLVLRTSLLEHIPNLGARIGGRVTRRSDMIWARLAVFYGGARVVQGEVAVTHDRSGPGRSSFSVDKLIDDVRGSALVKALDVLFGDSGCGRAPGRALSAALLGEATDAYVHHRMERTAAIRRSERWVQERIAQLLRQITLRREAGGHWFYNDDACSNASMRLQSALGELIHAYGEEPELPLIEDSEIQEARVFLTELPDSVRAFQASSC